MSMSAINALSCQYCYLDIDINNHRSSLALSAAFVHATDARYGFSSKDLRKLGGSEISRIRQFLPMDHEWNSKLASNQETIVTNLPPYGSRIIFRLYWDVAPLACENFATLCTNGGSTLHAMSSAKKSKPAPIGECGKELTYRNSIIHRIVPNFIIQGGDFVFGNGSGGESIFSGHKFKDERAGLGLKHNRAGILSMGNSGKNSNTSQFFITLDKAPQCDGKHVVFGEVISGMEIIHVMESFGSTSGEPSVPIKIIDCGAYLPLWTPSAGSWYDRPDSESYAGITSEFMVRPRVGILAPTKLIADKFRMALGDRASTLTVTTEDREQTDDAIILSLLEPLENFSLDLIVAAPACATLLSLMDIPSSWMDATKKLVEETCVPMKDSIFLIAKPVNVLDIIVNKSWLATRTGWNLIGLFQ